MSESDCRGRWRGRYKRWAQIRRTWRGGRSSRPWRRRWRCRRWARPLMWGNERRRKTHKPIFWRGNNLRTRFGEEAKTYEPDNVRRQKLTNPVFWGGKNLRTQCCQWGGQRRVLGVSVHIAIVSAHKLNECVKKQCLCGRGVPLPKTSAPRFGEVNEDCRMQRPKVP